MKLKTRLEKFKTSCDDEDAIDEANQLLTALMCPEALTVQMVLEIRERAEFLFCGLIHDCRVDR